MLFKKWNILLILVISVTILMASGSSATLLDLTTPGSMGTINGTIFITPPTITSGTGLIDSFLRIQANGKAPSEQGYNTDGALEFDTKGGAFTHSLQLSALQSNIATIGGIDYYEFVLDVNESPGNGIITLHEFEIYLDPAPNNSGYPVIGTLVYDFDVGPDGDSEVKLDYNNFSGSGKLDLFALVPTSHFGADLNQYVYLFSKFGLPDDFVDDGFEEWAHKTTGTFTSVPEPVTILLFGTLCLLGLGLSRKKEN